MSEKIKVVKVDHEYCDYLRKFDSRVSYNAGLKELRPFVGILFRIGDMEYYAPLSSPKPKHKTLKNTLDIIKIADGEYGIVNLNNMIPVTEENYIEYKLNLNSNDKAEQKRSFLLQTQLRWLNKNRKKIYDMSFNLYSHYKSKILPKRVRERCCNFPLLEEKCVEYSKLGKRKIFC